MLGSGQGAPFKYLQNHGPPALHQAGRAGATHSCLWALPKSPEDLGTWVSAQPAGVGRAGEGRPRVPRVWGAWHRSGEWEGAGGRAWGVGMVVGGVPGEPPSTGALKLEGSSRSPSCSPPGINVGALLPRGIAQGEQRGTSYCGQALV